MVAGPFVLRASGGDLAGIYVSNLRRADNSVADSGLPGDMDAGSID